VPDRHPEVKFLAKALSQRGQHVRADGTSKYGAWFGEQVHNSTYAEGDFCAMGLLWCAEETGQLDVLGGAQKTWAWVPSWWQHWKKIGRSTKYPARGRIVFFDFNRSGDPEHVAAVLEADGGRTPIPTSGPPRSCRASRTPRTATGCR
jgi:hypothetical protein